MKYDYEVLRNNKKREEITMRPFRGNCKQVAILESQLIASGMAMQIDSQQDPSIFSVQREFKPKLIINRYMVRTDVKEDKDGSLVGRNFLPKFYFCKFIYNMTTMKAESNMDREIINLLLRLLPEPLKSQLEEKTAEGVTT